ncbi:hypothetical protein Tco_1406713 [Tanacetum coccineum]
MHTTMVPEQVKTMKIQAGIQVSRPRELTRQLQLWKRFGRLYLIVFVLVRNIVTDDAKDGGLDEEDRKVTTWEELIKKFFCRFYPESYDGEDEMLDEGENWGIDPLEFLSNINTSFKNHKKMDGRTQKVIFHSWMNGNRNKRYVDNTYEVRDIEKQSQTKRKYSNTSNSINEQPNKRRCKVEKFEAIQYSLGPNEEYIAIRSYEYDISERNEDNMSNIYQDIFQKKETVAGPWKQRNIDEYWWRIYKSGDLEVLES